PPPRGPPCPRARAPHPARPRGGGGRGRGWPPGRPPPPPPRSPRHESTGEHAIACLKVLSSAEPGRRGGTCVTSEPSAPRVACGRCLADPVAAPCRPEPAKPFSSSSFLLSALTFAAYRARY